MDVPLHVVFGALAIFVAVIAVVPQLVVGLIKKFQESRIEQKQEAWKEAADSLGLEFREGDDRSSTWKMEAGREATIEGEFRGRKVEARVRRDLSDRRRQTFRFSTVVDVELTAESWDGVFELTARQDSMTERFGDLYSKTRRGGIARLLSVVVGELADEILGGDDNGRPVSVGVPVIDDNFVVDGPDSRRIQQLLKRQKVQSTLVSVFNSVGALQLSSKKLQIRTAEYLDEPDEIAGIVGQASQFARRLDEIGKQSDDQDSSRRRVETGDEALFPDV